MNSEEILRLALTKGASEAEAYIQDGTQIQVQFMGDDKEIKTVNSTGIGIRVAIGKRLGQYSTSILDENNVKNAVDRAILIAKASPMDDDWNNFNREFGATTSSRLIDKDISNLGPIELVSLVDEAITVVKEYDPRVKPSTGIISANTTSITINNTNAREINQTGTMISGYFYSKARDEDKTSTGSEFAQSRNLDEFNFRYTALESAQRAVRSLNAKPMKSKEIPVVIKNKVFASILGVMLSTPINADMVQKGASILADKIGEIIAADIVNVTDDGRMPSGLASSRFDDEGHSTQVTPIIEDGVLKNFIYDNYTALKDGIDSTGNGARAGYGSPVRPAISNLILSKSDADHDELVIDTKHGLYIESVIGEWLSNAISGEVNATVTHGFLIENGELTQPIKGVIIAGNFYEILLNGMETIGNDLQNSGGMYSPTVKIAKLSIAGNS
jgi:PmbA protein